MDLPAMPEMQPPERMDKVAVGVRARLSMPPMVEPVLSTLLLADIKQPCFSMQMAALAHTRPRLFKITRVMSSILLTAARLLAPGTPLADGIPRRMELVSIMRKMQITPQQATSPFTPNGITHSLTTAMEIRALQIRLLIPELSGHCSQH